MELGDLWKVPVVQLRKESEICWIDDSCIRVEHYECCRLEICLQLVYVDTR